MQSLPNYFRIENRVFLILRRYKQRGVAMVEGISFNGLVVTLPLNGVTFTNQLAA